MSVSRRVVSLLAAFVVLGAVLGLASCTRAEPVELGSRPVPQIDQQVAKELQTATFASG